MKKKYILQYKIFAYIMFILIFILMFLNNGKENFVIAEEKGDFEMTDKDFLSCYEIDVDFEISNNAVIVSYYADDNVTDLHAYRIVKKEGVELKAGEIVLQPEEDNPCLLTLQETYTIEEDGEGNYEVIYYLLDELSDVEQLEHITYKEVSFVLDGSAPELIILGVPDENMTKDTVELDFQIIENNPDFRQYKVYVTRSDLDTEEAWTDVCEWSEWEQEKHKAQRKITYEKEGKYEVTFDAVDRAGNKSSEKVEFCIDHTAPIISEVTYSDQNGRIGAIYNKICSNQKIRVDFKVTDQVAGVNDREVYVTVGKPDNKGKEIYVAHKAMESFYYVYVPTDLNVDEFSNVITIWGNDMLGNESCLSSAHIIYNLDKPQIQMQCDRDYTVWTNQDVTFHTTVSDDKSGLREITYKINGKVAEKIVFHEPVYSYDYELTASENAEKATGYAVTVEAVNNNGTGNFVKRQVYIDKEKPNIIISGVENGAHYNTNQIIETTVHDISYKDTKTVYKVKRVLDGKTYTMSLPVFYSCQYEDIEKWEIKEEGSYQIYAVTTDGAGNQSKSNMLNFVLDKTAPKVKVSGVKEGSMNKTAVSLDFFCEESFYATNEVNIQIERTLDGNTTKKAVSGFQGQDKSSSMRYTFQEDGTYKVTISATDKAGNAAKSKTITFSVDVTRPEIYITGTENYEQWKRPVTIRFVIKESYFKGNHIRVWGMCKDIEGNITRLEIPQIVSAGKTSALIHTFDQDGIYTILIDSRDEAGNHESSQIHFTVDQTKPQISGVKQFDGGYYQKFKLCDTLEEVFKDLTVVSYRILLNGIEYNGTDEITEEGKYLLFVDVKDELGHDSNEMAEFIIDHTPPKVIFSGVKDGELVKEKGTVTLALVNKEDEITGVRMNGEDYGADTRSLAFYECGAYHIEVDCIDKAGNAVTENIHFVYNTPETMVLLFGKAGMFVGIAGILVLVWFIRKNGRKRGFDESSSI